MTKENPNLNKNITHELAPQIFKYIYKVYDNAKISEFIESVIDTEKKLLGKDPSFVNTPRKIFLKRISKLTDEKEKLNLVIKYYILQIDAHFSPFIFKTLSLIASYGFALLLYPLTLWNMIKGLFLANKMLGKKVILEGDFDYIRSLEKKGTLIFVPNHTSNYDSIVLSNRLTYLGIKTPMWGAGLNLYANAISRFVLNNAACYRVDRRNKTRLYLETLKQYSRFYLGKGFNTIFYPGGTRSRSGKMEQRLKLGLMGTVVDAFVENSKKQKYFIIPIIMTYDYVPEDEKLSFDYFYGKAKRKKIMREKKQKLSFFEKLKDLFYKIGRSNRMYLKFGDVIMPNGELYLKKYATPKEGLDIYDREYNKELTGTLGKSIAKQYKEYNSVSAMNVFYRSILNTFLETNKTYRNLEEKELLEKLRLARVSYADVIESINNILLKLSNKHYLLKGMKAVDIFKMSLKLSKNTVKWNGKTLIILTPELVFYYANKLNFL